MSQTYYDNIKKPKLQDTLLGILKIYAFCQNIQQRALCPRESTAGVKQYLPLRIYPKTQWFKGECLWSTLVMLRLVSRLHILRLHQLLTYIEGNNQTDSPIWNYVTGNLISRYSTQLQGSAQPCKLKSNQNMGELQQSRNKNDNPFRQTITNN